MYDKISLHLYSFDENIVDLLEIQNLKILELATEFNFKEMVKRKPQIYEFSNDQTIENIVDKCIICGDHIDTEEITNFNNNQISSEDEIENNLNFKEDKINNMDNIAKCPYCNSLFHLICLAESSIDNQGLINFCLIPKESQCLICEKKHKWSEFMKD